MEGLDASYALLSDVNARNRELQARLRSSLPLLWTNNALVMKSATAPRRRRGAERAGDSEADQMLLALEGHASLQVSRRYKRRVEWEVARRIARVDRELQQYPPAQRFWNQRRKEPTPRQSSSYKQRVNTIEKVGTTGVRQKQTVGKTGTQQEKRFFVKPKVWVETSEEKRVVKHVATSPLRDGEIEEKENVMPNAATRTQIGERNETRETKELSLWKDVTAMKKVANDLLDEKAILGDKMKESHSDDPVAVHEPIDNELSSGRGDQSSDSPHPAPSSQAGTIADIHQDSNHENTFEIEESSPRIKIPSEERPSSSIGRQVLSEFRTMPSVASFGAQPMLSVGGLGNPGDMRLNVDVLRRLFSDLDTDKDGHVNRIETCMALHRLQISVPTTKIISFFRHIHSGKSVRSRRTQHLPISEVINYKEFVAFVTAAYDQQQQQKAKRGRAPARHQAWKENHGTDPPLFVPSMSLPIYSHPTNTPRTTRYAHASIPLREEQVRVYEVDDTNSHQGVAIEKKVLHEIPDILVSKILADTSSADSVEVNADVVSVVRRSLESLVGKEAVDDKIVNEITQDLISERLRTVGTLSQDDMYDVTGLKRAAAYYNEQAMLGDIDSCSVVEDLSSEESVNWVDVLTEEQVSGLVQHIWKDRQAALYHTPLESVKDIHVEDLAEIPTDQSVKWKDEATDTNEFTNILTVSEKAVQTFDGDQEISASTPESTLEENRNEIAAPIPAPATSGSMPLYSPRTNLARALTTSLNDSFDELFSPVTSIGILQRLRHQRRMNTNMFDRHQQYSCMDEAMQQKSSLSDANCVDDINAIQIDGLDRGSIFTSEEECESVSSCSVGQQDPLNHVVDNQNLMSLPTTEFVPLTPKVLNVDDHASNEGGFELANSISTSSSGFSSTSNYYMHGMYREIDHHQRYTRTRTIRSRRPHRRQRRLPVSESSVPDSNWSAELSEGEFSLEEALDLSDGEIFGERKKQYIRHKNEASYVKSKDDDDSLYSSVESGELPALMKTHANFRHQLVVQSISSVESGEHEDGTVFD